MNKKYCRSEIRDLLLSNFRYKANESYFINGDTSKEARFITRCYSHFALLSSK